MQLEGSSGILTGASRGIGVVVAQELARRGVSLALVARDEAGLKETVALVEAAGGRAVAIPTDVTSRADLERLVERATTELGPIDLLINNAGAHKVVEFHKMDVEAIERIVSLNVVGTEILTRLVLPGMIERGRGHVVCVSSIAGKYSSPYFSVYSSTKHALVGFSLSLREEMRPFGVGVSVVCPATIAEVGMWQDDIGEPPPGVVSTVTPRDVADGIVRVIEKNKAQLLIGGLLPKVGGLVQAISPDAATQIPRRSGVYRFLREVARREKS